MPKEKALDSQDQRLGCSEIISYEAWRRGGKLLQIESGRETHNLGHLQQNAGFQHVHGQRHPKVLQKQARHRPNSRPDQFRKFSLRRLVQKRSLKIVINKKVKF